jgi:hypothetical protein
MRLAHRVSAHCSARRPQLTLLPKYLARNRQSLYSCTWDSRGARQGTSSQQRLGWPPSPSCVVACILRAPRTFFTDTSLNTLSIAARRWPCSAVTATLASPGAVSAGLFSAVARAAPVLGVSAVRSYGVLRDPVMILRDELCVGEDHPWLSRDKLAFPPQRLPRRLAPLHVRHAAPTPRKATPQDKATLLSLPPPLCAAGALTAHQVQGTRARGSLLLCHPPWQSSAGPPACTSPQ